MSPVAAVLVGVVALIHIYIFVFEAFLWQQRGPSVFRSFPRDLFPATTALAFNQGVYNLFLAAGLIWALMISDGYWTRGIATFFLACVAVAGVAGAMTERKIIVVQTVPGLAALIALWVL